MELQSTITCPVCDFSVKETMPEDACLFFWECPSCGEVAKPKAKDCCVYCSYGTMVCPSKQNKNC